MNNNDKIPSKKITQDTFVHFIRFYFYLPDHQPMLIVGIYIFLFSVEEGGRLPFFLELMVFSKSKLTTPSPHFEENRKRVKRKEKF